MADASAIWAALDADARRFQGDSRYSVWSAASDADRAAFAREVLAALDTGRVDERWSELLTSPDTPDSAKVLRRMAKLGGAPTLAAVRALRERGATGVEPLLAPLLATPSSASDAASLLVEIGGDDAVDLLIASAEKADDPEARYPVMQAVHRLVGLEALERTPGSLLWFVLTAATVQPRAVRDAAFPQWSDWIRRTRSGATAAELGLALPDAEWSDAMRSIGPLVMDADTPFPPDALDALDERGLVWVASILLGALERGESRAVPAMERIRARGLPPLVDAKLALALEAYGRG
jgi:hypothetical protein